MSGTELATPATGTGAALAQRAVEWLKKRGAESAVVVEKRRSVSVETRERRVETLKDANSASLSVAIYVEGKYGGHVTSDLAWPALEKFLGDAVAMTRALEPDRFRSLPDPRWYAGRSSADLGLADATYEAFSAAERKGIALAVEEAALSGEAGGIQSVSAWFGDERREMCRVTSNGFTGLEEATAFWTGASVTMRDGDRRPEDYWNVATRRRAELGDPAAIGREAARRARMRVGAKKVAGGAMTVLVENQTAGRLLHHLLAAASAPALQQKRSFLEGKVGAKVASEALTMLDDPLVAGGLGSRAFDGEGIAAKRFPLVEAGVLRNFYVDWYYGRKLGMDPTTGGTSNLVVAPGKRSLAEIEKSIDRGLLVTSFLGGNSNSLTGDFSVGVQGVLVEKGARTQPVVEMNLAG
ncbi:MAG TPA: TldD/PmbA family protein, partial [Planctomycetota bacterium]|nr:TldD/PmbA family protein [Planctomycetota bacterium]